MVYIEFIKKIDDFIRKYHLNKIVRGIIWFCAIFLLSFLLLVIAEYFGYFGIYLKTFLFYFFTISQLVLAWLFIGRHLINYLKLGKSINYEQASIIIGKYFPEVADKLTNTLQLKKALEDNPEQQELIAASIKQRISQLQPVPFVSAIKISENKKYLHYALIPIFITIILSFSAPAILSEGTNRIIEHDKYFVKRAPFQFQVLNNSLTGVESEDFLFKLKMNGDQIPQDIYIEDGSNSFKLEKEDIIHFNYLFKNLKENKTFRLKAGDYYSEFYTLEVKKKPALTQLKVNLIYPGYLQMKNKTLDNPGDINVPAGTLIKWTFTTENASSLSFTESGKKYQLKPLEPNTFIQQIKAVESRSYHVQAQNSNIQQEAITYQVNVIPDAYPQIEVIEKPDSLNNRVLYFIGKANDDYGLSKLAFHYQISKSPVKERQGKSYTTPIKFNRNKTYSDFFHFWPLSNLGVQPGEEVTYYFEVADNDGINGPKKVRSAIKTYKLATKEESIDKVEESSENIKQDIQTAIKQAQKIQEEAKKLNHEIRSNNSLDFEQKKQAEQLLDKQQKLEELLKKINDEHRQNLGERQQLQTNKEILEKQKQIQDLFENVLDDKTKELLKNLQKLLDEKNEAPQENFQQLQTDNKSLKKELDRILELYKKLEVEQKVNQAIDQLKELAKNQEENINKNNIEQQQEISKEFSDIKTDLKETDEKNKALEQAEDFKNPEQEQKDIDQKLNEALQSMQQNKKQKASEAQENAAQKMEELAKKLEEMQEEGEKQESNVNEQELRQLLQNLLKSSFDQENVMIDLKNTDPNDPRFKNLGQKQKDIQDNIKMVEDSLYSLSKRVPQISSTVNKEIESINQQITSALENLTERKLSEVYKNQQYALTSINNLSLMLSEALQQLQNAMKNAKSGGKGKPKPGMSELSKMQKELSKNMQKAKEQMQQEGATKPSQSKSKQMSESFVKMAQQQQMIRQALQEINQKLNKDGQGKLGNLEKIIDQMEQTETDLVNKRINQEALLRQQDIQQRLLEAENAEREREFDNQKESKSGKIFAPNYNIMLKEYQKIKQKETEMIKTISPELNNFYKSKISEYFKKINTGN